MNTTDRKILFLAAAMISDNARDFKDGCTIRGRWPAGSEKDQKSYEAEMWTAAQLRLIAGRKRT